MARRHRLTVLTASVALGVGMTTLLAACSNGDTPSASPSSSSSSGGSSSGSGGSSSGPSATPTDDQTGSADDGTGPGTGNGSGVDNPTSVDWKTLQQQGVAAAGGGTAISFAGSGDNWTVVAVGPDGSETRSVISVTLARVTSGPFPVDADAATKAADAARAAAVKTDAAAAASAAEHATADAKLSSLVLGGTASAPVWTATLAVGGASKTVTVDGLTGTVAGA